MAATRISAAKARAHTRKQHPSKTLIILSKLWPKALLLVGSIAISLIVSALRPPPPTVCGTPNGPPITAPRVKLSDGRHLAYKEGGVAKEEARYKIILTHGYTRSRHDQFPASKEVIQKLGVYFVSYDRPGYGQSDPDPRRSIRSASRDLEELADALQLGPKFYIISNSMGGHTAWSCLKYIPHRLAGVAMVVPVVNYWWPSLSTPEANAVFNALPLGDRLFLRVAHYAPWLVHWWTRQKFLPTSSTVNPQQASVCKSDLEIRAKMRLRASKNPEISKEALQQGSYESLNRDTIVQFGNWEFDPAELVKGDETPVVHIFQGARDYLVPAELQRMVAEKHEWIHYHEFPELGHLLLGVEGLPDQILETLLIE